MKHKKLLIGILVLVLGAGYWLFASFNGSLIAKMIMTSKAKNYVEVKYPNDHYEVEFAKYDFKMWGYYCTVQSTDSKDTHFDVWKDGESMTDNFENWVTKRENTLSRLSQAMYDYSDKIIARICPYRYRLALCDISDSVTEEQRESLELDMPFDAKNFPLPLTLVMWIETQNDKPTWEELAERLREIEALVRDELPGVEYYSIQIEYKYTDENGELVPEKYMTDVYADNVPREVITAGNLEAFLEQQRWEHPQYEEPLE